MLISEKVSFGQQFSKLVLPDDWISITIKGIEYRAQIWQDNHYNIDDDDCHNPDQKVTGCSPAQQLKLLEARAAYARGDWFYCGIVVSAHFGAITLDKHAASLWGIEANYPGTKNEYLNQVADELLLEAIPLAEAELDSIVKAACDRR
jgi:hypothetical protein